MAGQIRWANKVNHQIIPATNQFDEKKKEKKRRRATDPAQPSSMSQSTNNASVKTSFELALDKFRAQLSDQERVKFAVTKKGDLQVAILNIQNEQRLSKKMVNMRRAQGFIEAMEQFGKVIEVFVNSSEILAFVWGPMKFLLLVSGFVGAFFFFLIT